MPRNGKEGILFSFIMSAIMIYVMAALNYGVRTGDVGPIAWRYAAISFPLAYVVGMICDLCVCTPTSRALMNRFCKPADRPVFKGLTVKFLMVVLMTVCMTIFGTIMAFGFTFEAFLGFWRMFPYNFTIALPIQMLIVAPFAGWCVHRIGDRAGWNVAADQRAQRHGRLDLAQVSDVMQTDVYRVADTATVRDAVRVIVERKVSGVPVVSVDGKVTGFVSDADVLRAFARDNAPVSDVSTLITGMARDEFPDASHNEVLSRNVMSIANREPITVTEGTTVAELCSMFGYRQLKKVPVVDETGRLVGIVNRSRLTRRSFSDYLAVD